MSSSHDPSQCPMCLGPKLELQYAAPEAFPVTPVAQNDEIDHPAHYTAGSIEVIDFLESQPGLDFRAAAAIKYLARYKIKGRPSTDLAKALWYIKRILKTEYGVDA